jgi:protein-S-isoprenylcysteine O-methyltransferase Ste14
MKNLRAGRMFAQILFLTLANGAALVRWGYPDLWSRVDRYSIAAVALLALMASMTVRIFSALGLDARREFFGDRFDPVMLRVRHLLRLFEWLTFLDYARGPIGPSLRVPLVQQMALALAPLALMWLWRVDAYLIAHFPATLAGAMMRDGPFRRIRHPRYAGILAGRLAFAALIGSALGWAQLVVHAALFLQRMAREERHLRAAFPSEYSAYMLRTGRVFPAWRARG